MCFGQRSEPREVRERDCGINLIHTGSIRQQTDVVAVQALSLSY